MHPILHIPAESLASDNLWPALVFIAALASMACFRAMGSRIAQWRLRRPRKITG